MEQDFSFEYITKGNASPKNKPHVFFTCHPLDFERFFDKICEDVFATHDCVIYYTKDMGAEIPEEYRDVDLERMNLFVIPISFRLLSQYNRAMDVDYPFAKNKHIPILPIMMESGIDDIYCRPEKFGALQYLNPYGTDSTEINYHEKLKKYLDSVLISDETTKRIKLAFDAYIFLSYRKKDRKLANELMRLIHSNEKFRDIAVWYDEFLTPGESFKQNIKHMLRSSKMFALLVTPNLLEEPNGKPNFVMGTEYPEAKKISDETGALPILPSEMVDDTYSAITDKKALKDKYPGLPECVKVDDDYLQVLADVLCKTARQDEIGNPMHNYLIGLAYLEGIDVERNVDRAVELITSAAEAEQFEAMEKIRDMYKDGIGVSRNYPKAVEWSRKIIGYCKKMYSESDQKTIDAIQSLIDIYYSIGDYLNAKDECENLLAIKERAFGETALETMDSFRDYAILWLKSENKFHKTKDGEVTTFSFGDQSVNSECDKLFEKIYTTRREKLGELHPETILSLSDLLENRCTICSVNKQDIDPKTRGLCDTMIENYYLLTNDIQVEYIFVLMNAAYVYTCCHDYSKVFSLYQKSIGLCCSLLGDAHETTILLKKELAEAYNGLGSSKSIVAEESGSSDCGEVEFEKSLQLLREVYEIQRSTLGEDHVNTIKTLMDIACAHILDFEEEFRLWAKVYEQQEKVFGENSVEVIQTLEVMASIIEYSDNEDWDEIELLENLYKKKCAMLGEKHPDTIEALESIANTYERFASESDDMEWYELALPLRKKIYKLCYEVFGPLDLDTIRSCVLLAHNYYEQKKFRIALSIYKTALAREEKANHRQGVKKEKSFIALTYYELGEYEEALRVCDELSKEKFGQDILSRSVIERLAKIYDGTGYAEKALYLRQKLSNE